jgi:hypothetical protein
VPGAWKARDGRHPFRIRNELANIFAWEMIFMANRLLNIVSLAALVVFPAHSQSLPAPGQEIVAVTTYFQFITEDDVDQRTKLDLLLATPRLRTLVSLTT